MKKNFLLLLSLMLLLSVSAIAGPRSYQQAKAIAQRQAAMLGIEMDAEVAASAKVAPRMSTQGRLRCTQHTILCTALQVLLLFRTQSGLR